MDSAADVLKNLHGFGGKPIHLESVVEDEGIRLSFNGEKAGITKVGKCEMAKERLPPVSSSREPLSDEGATIPS